MITQITEILVDADQAIFVTMQEGDRTMELNAEQIKKALERCANEWHCGLCGFTEKECALIKKSALAIIISQEQRIAELEVELDAMRGAVNSCKLHNEKLTEERDGFENLAYTAIETQNRMSDTIEELTEENESLTEELAKAYSALDGSMNFYCSFAQSKIQNCPIDDEVAKAKADTVREMQAEIEARCIKGGIYPVFVKSTIDKVAKEMLEGSNEPY